MLHPNGAQIPNGKIQLELTDSKNISHLETLDLKNVSLTHLFTNVACGDVTVTATYIAEITEYSDTYSNSDNNTSNHSKPEIDSNAATSAPNVSVSQFTDLKNHWAKDDIQFVINKGLFKGVSENNFGVNISTNRAMFITILHRLAGTPKLDRLSSTDVKSGQYYSDAVA